MTVIDDCPICKVSFMYDPTWDRDLYVIINKQEVVICRSCHEKNKSSSKV